MFQVRKATKASKGLRVRKDLQPQKANKAFRVQRAPPVKQVRKATKASKGLRVRKDLQLQKANKAFRIPRPPPVKQVRKATKASKGLRVRKDLQPQKANKAFRVPRPPPVKQVRPVPPGPLACSAYTRYVSCRQQLQSRPRSRRKAGFCHMPPMEQ